jgi:hypothetical protein
MQERLLFLIDMRITQDFYNFQIVKAHVEFYCTKTLPPPPEDKIEEEEKKQIPSGRSDLLRKQSLSENKTPSPIFKILCTYFICVIAFY